MASASGAPFANVVTLAFLTMRSASSFNEVLGSGSDSRLQLCQTTGSGAAPLDGQRCHGLGNICTEELAVLAHLFG